MTDYTYKLPAPFGNIHETSELHLAQLAHQVRALAVAAYGTEFAYQESTAWLALCNALESHRRARKAWGDEAMAHTELRVRMSDALGLSTEGDDGFVQHEYDPDELVAAAEAFRDDQTC